MIKKNNLLLYLLFFSFVSSVVYFPIEVMGTAIVSRIMPIILLIIILFLLNEKIKIKHIKVYIPLFIIIILFSISSFSKLNSIIYLVNFFLYSLFFLAMYVLFDLYGYIFIKKYSAMIYGFAIFVSVLAIFEYFFYYQLNNIFIFRGSPYYESKGQVCSLYSNPNIFGLMTALSMQLAFIAYNSKLKILISSIFIIIGVLLSGSRMALAILILIFIVNFFKIKFSSFFMVCFSIIILILLSIITLVFSNIIDLNFRDIIWGAAVNIHNENPYFGVGIGNFQDEISKFLNINWVQGANNMFWGLLAETGIVTSIVFYLFLLRNTSIFNSLQGKYKVFDFKVGFLMSLLIISQFSEYFIIYVTQYLFLLFLSMSAIIFNRRLNEKNIIS